MDAAPKHGVSQSTMDCKGECEIETSIAHSKLQALSVSALHDEWHRRQVTRVEQIALDGRIGVGIAQPGGCVCRRRWQRLPCGGVHWRLPCVGVQRAWCRKQHLQCSSTLSTLCIN